MSLAVGDGRGIWRIPGVCPYPVGHTSVPPYLGGAIVRTRVGNVMFVGVLAVGMGQELRSTMRFAAYDGGGFLGCCRLGCFGCAPWCGWVAGSGMPVPCRCRFGHPAPRLVVPRGVGSAVGVGGACACGPAAAGSRRPAYVRQAGCARVSLCVRCLGYTDGTLV